MNVLIFGGTTEGRKLSDALLKAGIEVTLSVATGFGREAAEEAASASILTGRLDKSQMTSLIRRGGFDCVIDATHPYAALATENIRRACDEAYVKYMRLKRPESGFFPGVIYAESPAAAAEILKEKLEEKQDSAESSALLTIGSKELAPFTRIKNYQKRLFIRVLPMEEALKKAVELGFRRSNIICMQGPFQQDMNEATIKATGAKWLVTKDSGETGGVSAKISAAENTGCGVIMIGRPVKEHGCSFQELLDFFGIYEPRQKLQAPRKEPIIKIQPRFFPLFVNAEGRSVVVLGGGAVAERRIKKLLSFGADITVISPAVTEHISRLAAEKALRLITREYRKGDIAALAPFIAVAATNSSKANDEAAAEAKETDTLISVAHCRSQCTFYFPAIMESESYIGGLVSKNGEHGALSETAEKIRGLLKR